MLSHRSISPSGVLFLKGYKSTNKDFSFLPGSEIYLLITLNVPYGTMIGWLTGIIFFPLIINKPDNKG